MSGPLLHHHSLIKGVSAVLTWQFDESDFDFFDGATYNVGTDRIITITPGSSQRFPDAISKLQDSFGVSNEGETNYIHCVMDKASVFGVVRARKYNWERSGVVSMIRVYESNLLKFSQAQGAGLMEIQESAGSMGYFYNGALKYTSLEILDLPYYSYFANRNQSSGQYIQSPLVLK